uniref:Uncharacterized protein n=1 Tax=Ananas comosus var. bracteatus TaxID=296719 RepID=A0A6V7Q9G2_ANACO|nr:unnamed protein product [Ananas comosus var. bracteatus]
MVAAREGNSRRGPWSEQEDLQLVRFVRLFGERRWDYLAKVSGLSRSGKSCRLRWVNYLHPSLKRGPMTPQEEELVIELHDKWGNRYGLKYFLSSIYKAEVVIDRANNIRPT